VLRSLDHLTKLRYNYLPKPKKGFIMSRLTTWPSKDKAVKISEMDLSHLHNTVRLLHKYAEDRRVMFRRNGYETEYNGRYIQDWIMDMDREIKRRNKLRFGL
jgi:hypothetical protein